jgi:arginine repressor
MNVMPRGVPKKAAKSGEITKAEHIRQTAKKMGKTVRPKDIIAALKEQGITVGYSEVSKTLKKIGFHRKTKGKKPAAAKSSSSKKAVAASTSSAASQVNKAQRIREVAKTLGKKVRPRDVIAELAKEGVSVSSAQVSTTLSAAGYRRKRRGKKVGGAAAHPASGNGLNLEALIAAKALIAKVGSVEAAQEALAVLKKLG